MLVVRILKLADYIKRAVVSILFLVPASVVAHIVRRMEPHREVWLVAERPDEARDNGYHFYQYLIKERPNTEVYYVIEKQSADLHKIKKIGPYIVYGSLRHYFMYAFCHVALSTHWHGAAPFGAAGALVLPILPRKLTVHLRHGIGQTHYSTFRRILTARHPSIMIFGARAEYEYYRQHYPDSQSKMVYTGFARFDALHQHQNPKRQILLMPTFRKWIFDLSRLPKDKALAAFKEQSFFHQFNQILQSTELHEALKTSDVKLVFYPHYRIHPFLEAFESCSPHVIIANRYDFDVQELLMESALLVTDYSSVFFDFAYMGKPVIYFQFDAVEYHERHYKAGYFSYERDGFGPVLRSAADVVREIISSIRTEFQLTSIYRSRVERFFELRDRDNCSRILASVESALSDIRRPGSVKL